MATIPSGSVGVKPANTGFDPIPAVDEYSDPTILNVEVEKVELREINAAYREKFNIEATHEFNITFVIQDGPYKNRKIWGNAQALWYEGNCRLRLWAQAILGVDDFPEDYEFDSDHIVGHRCRVTVKNYTKKDGTVGESVADVRPARPTSGATAAPVQGSLAANDDEEPFNSGQRT